MVTDVLKIKQERQRELNELLEKITKEFNEYGMSVEFEIDMHDVNALGGTNKQIVEAKIIAKI